MDTPSLAHVLLQRSILAVGQPPRLLRVLLGGQICILCTRFAPFSKPPWVADGRSRGGRLPCFATTNPSMSSVGRLTLSQSLPWESLGALSPQNLTPRRILTGRR